MKRYFLVDLENVGKNFLDGTRELTIEDILVICHNKSNGPLSIKIKNELSQTKAVVKMVSIFNAAKNAMDFCLCTQLGYFLASEENRAAYYIISNDKGYDAAIDFIKSQYPNIKVKRISSIRSYAETLVSQEENRNILTALLTGYNKKVVCITHRCLENAKNLSEYHSLLQKNLYNYQVQDIFNKTRHLVSVA